MGSQAHYQVKSRNPHTVLAHVTLVGVASNPPTVSSDPNGLISGIARDGTGDFEMSMSDDWSYVSGKVNVHSSAAEDLGYLWAKSYTKGAVVVELRTFSGGSADDLNGKTFTIDFVMER